MKGRSETSLNIRYIGEKLSRILLYVYVFKQIICNYLQMTMAIALRKSFCVQPCFVCGPFVLWNRSPQTGSFAIDIILSGIWLSRVRPLKPCCWNLVRAPRLLHHMRQSRRTGKDARRALWRPPL